MPSFLEGTKCNSQANPFSNLKVLTGLHVSFGQSICHRCGEGSGRKIVTLWDNQNYCSSCIEGAAPGLLEYASTHTVLREAVPSVFNECLPGMLSLYRRTKLHRHFALLLAFVVLLLIAQPSIITGAVVSIVSAIVVALHVLALRAFLGFMARTKNRLLEIRAADGVIEIVRVNGCSRIPFIHSSWCFVSKNSLESFSATFEKVQGEGLLLVSDKRNRLPDRKSTAWCGHDPEWLERWRAFVTLAGVDISSVAQIEGKRQVISELVRRMSRRR